MEITAVDRHKIHLIRGSGVSLNEFVNTPLPLGGALAILPARLIREKGVSAFADAARLVRKLLPEARFALVGDTQPSHPHAVPASIIDAWVEEGVIEWWGHRTDMPAVMAEASVVCLPSTYGEGVPKVLIEAAACARPIIATDIAGCREVVIDGESGFLVPPDDLSALVNALVALLGNREKCVEMGQRGREIVVEGFTIERVVAETLTIYANVDQS